MVSQEDKDLMRSEMLLEARENERQECIMMDIDCFMESDVVAEYLEAFEVLKKACDEYGHDIEDVI